MRYVRRKLRHDPWWHVAGLLLGLAFAVMLMMARLHPGVLDSIDMAVEAIVLPLQTFTTVQFFLAITVLGGKEGIIAAALCAAVLLRHNRFSVFQLALLLACVGASIQLAKVFVARARPEALMWLDPLNTYSFPSGHATLSAAFYSFVAVCLYRRAHSKAGKLLSIVIPALVILLVGSSRIVLSVHYFTDVIAGTLLGLFWVSVIYMLPRPR